MKHKDKYEELYAYIDKIKDKRHDSGVEHDIKIKQSDRVRKHKLYALYKYLYHWEFLWNIIRNTEFKPDLVGFYIFKYKQDYFTKTRLIESFTPLNECYACSNARCYCGNACVLDGFAWNIEGSFVQYGCETDKDSSYYGFSNHQQNKSVVVNSCARMIADIKEAIKHYENLNRRSYNG